jgi:D-methionine transport system ATP-binding protein
MIEIQNLYKSYGSLEVLKDISFKIEKGDIFGIIGQSGAGKSTLLRCFNGLENFQKGEVIDTVKVKDMVEQKINVVSQKQMSDIQKEMGMIFQNFNLLNRLNVYDNIALPLKFWKQDPHSLENKQRIEKLLKLVGLEEKSQAYPRQLSGGQKQRVAIARALVLNPKILLCDEATSALDPQITRDILNLLLKINKEMNITIVVVTHQMEVIKQICNKVAFLKDGRVLSVGKPEELFVAPNQEIQKFVGDDIEILPQTGKNIKLFFTNNNSKSHTITQLARTLDINFDICQGKLENFRGSMMGSLIINIDEKDLQAVENYLDQEKITWEEIV